MFFFKKGKRYEFFSQMEEDNYTQDIQKKMGKYKLSKSVLIWLGIVLFVKLLDELSTILFISKYGIAYEANRLVVFLFGFMGYWGLIISFLVFNTGALLIILLLDFFEKKGHMLPYMRNTILTICVFLVFLVAVHNTVGYFNGNGFLPAR